MFKFPYHTVPCHAVLYATAPNLTLQDFAMPNRFPCLIAPDPIPLHRNKPYPAVLHLTKPNHTTMPYRTVPCQTTSNPITPYHTGPCFAKPLCLTYWFKLCDFKPSKLRSKVADANESSTILQDFAQCQII